MSLYLEGIVLAGGFSSRAGVFKMTCPILEKPVIEYVIDAMASVCPTILVVCGWRADLLSYLPEKYPIVRLIYNEQYPGGMFTSVMAGLTAATGDRLFITPGDCPAVSPNTYREMAKGEGEILLPSYHGKTGHPVRLGKKAAQAALMSRCLSLRQFLVNYGYTKVEVNDPGILLDIDCPGDFEDIENYLKGQGQC